MRSNESTEKQTYLQTQHKILTSNLSNAILVRWDKSTLKLCLNLRCKGAKVYEDFRDSQIFQLPSGRHLRRLKNRVTQTPECLEWIYSTSCSHVVIQDEAKIQQDLVINVRGKRKELIGLIDAVEEAGCLTVFRES